MTRSLPVLRAGLTLAITASTLVLAQAPATPAAPAASAPAIVTPPPVKITPHGCPKPEWPGRVATEIRRKAFDREFNAFKDCMFKFVDTQKVESAKHAELQNNAVSSGNAAINEYNDYIKELNELSGRTPKDEKK